jgi:hypothetical protein
MKTEQKYRYDATENKILFHHLNRWEDPYLERLNKYA